MKISIGKQYRIRYGGISGVIRENPEHQYPFTDGRYRFSADGKFVVGCERHELDLIAEVEVRDVLPFELKAGTKYCTVKPDGTAGPITDELYKSVDMPEELVPFEFCDYWVGPTGLCAPNGPMPVLQITSEYIEPKPPTPLERLEKWHAGYMKNTGYAETLEAIIADLKAEATK